MIENQTHSYISFSNNVTRSFINKYNPECDVVDCYVCRKGVFKVGFRGFKPPPPEIFRFFFEK